MYEDSLLGDIVFESFILTYESNSPYLQSEMGNMGNKKQ